MLVLERNTHVHAYTHAQCIYIQSHTKMRLSIVAYAHNPSFLGGRSGRTNVKFKVILVYIASSSPARTTQKDPISVNK